jgi:hypothetical protein
MARKIDVFVFFPLLPPRRVPGARDSAKKKSKANSGRFTDNQKRDKAGEEVTLKGEKIKKALGGEIKIDKNKVKFNLSRVKVDPKTGSGALKYLKKLK